MVSSDDILRDIAPVPTVTIKQRHSYIIMGKPGSGKTTLAAKLAQLTKNHHLNSEWAVSQISSTSTDPSILEMEQNLRAGGTMDSTMLNNRLNIKLKAENSLARGVVLDFEPDLSAEDPAKSYEDFLIDFISTFKNCVLIDLQMTDQDLIRRRGGLWIDPVTNQCYPAQQVYYSRRRRQEGWTDGQPDPEMEKELLMTKTTFNTKKAEKKPEENDLGEDEEQVVPEPEDLHLASNFYLDNRKCYPILAEVVLDRLIKSPEHDPAQVERDLERYKALDAKREEIKRKYFNIFTIIEMDGTQHPDMLFSQLETKLHIRRFSVYDPFIESIDLNTEHKSFEGIPEADAIRHFAKINLSDFAPDRTLGMFGKYCPVEYFSGNGLVSTSMENALEYRGKIYFFLNPANMKQFQDYPDKYLAVEKTIPPFKCWIVGAPDSGKSTVAKSLAKKYNLEYINVEEQILMLETNAESNDTVSNLKNVLLTGECLSSQHYINILDKLAKSESPGWVLDGLPLTLKTVELLSSIKMVPKSIFNVKSDNAYYDKVPISCVPALTPLSNQFTDEMHNPNPFREKACTEIAAKIGDCANYFLENKIDYRELNWEMDSACTLNALIQMVDPFTPQAIPWKKTNEKELANMGTSKDHCPVMLRNDNKMIKGNQAISAKFQERVYYFLDEAAKIKFCEIPYRFLMHKDRPPVRLMFLGSTGSGRTTLIKKLGDKWGVPVVDFYSYCESQLEQLTTEERDELKFALTEKNNIPFKILVKILKSLYESEPYAAKGFLLNGLGTKKGDLQTAIKEYIYPDAFVFFKVETEIAAKRKLPATRLDLERQEAERLKRFEENPTDPKNIETLLKSDEKIIEDLSVIIDQENVNVADCQSLAESQGNVSVITVVTSRTLRPVWADLNEKLKPFLENRASICESCYPIEADQADYLLNAGLFSFSSIGKYCPVTLVKAKKVTLNTFGSIPVISGDHIYFLRSTQRLAEFEKDLHSYVNLQTPETMLSSTCCIVGQPKAGKTLLAKALVEPTDSVYLSASLVLQTILNGQENTLLYETIVSELSKGGTVSDDTLAEAITLVTNRVIASGRGWILDGYPLTFNQAQALAKSKFQPHKIFNLMIDEREIISRTAEDLANSDPAKPRPYLNIPELNLNRNKCISQEIQQIKQLFDQTFSNWCDIDASQSRWLLKHQLQNISETVMERKRTYLDLKVKGHAAPVYEIGIANDMIRDHKSLFGQYCPISLIDDNELVVSPSSLQYCAEYKQKFFFMADERQLKRFLANPEKYHSGKLPELLPMRKLMTEIVFPKSLALKGYCPVTFKEGPTGFSSIVPGEHSLIVQYGEEYYALATPYNLEKFMKTPWNYVGQTLPMKLPPPAAPIAVQNLPNIGYLEQTLASALSKSLMAVGTFRPKYPFKSISQSASEYIALHLKSSNPRSQDWKRNNYDRMLKEFEQNCALTKEVAESFAETEKELKDIDQVFIAKVQNMLLFSQ